MIKRHKKLSMLCYIVTAFILFNMNKVAVFAKETDIHYVKCGTSTGIPQPVPQLTSLAFNLLIIATPLVLVAFSIVTLIKAIASSNADDISKAKSKLLRKIIMTAIIFLVAPIIKFTVNRVASTTSDKNTFSKCMSCFLYYSTTNCPKDYNGSGNDVTSNTIIPPDTSRNRGNSNVASNRQRTSNKSGSNPDLAPKTNAVLVGDSKTVGLCKWNSSRLYDREPCRDYIAIAQVGMGSGWFDSTAVHSIDQAVANDKYNILILMGTNDTGNTTNAVNTYTKIIKDKASSAWSNDTIIFVSVTPIGPKVGGGMSITQDGVNTFNASMKSSIETLGLKNVKYCDIVTGVDYQSGISDDGVHYTADGYDKVYEQILNKCF